MSCIFCQIIKKEIKSEFIFENENMVVFKDINPKAPMHLLLVPKKHLGSLNALSEGDKAIMGDIIYQAKILAETFGLDKTGYRLLTNTGSDSGQEVMHIHFHLLGGKPLASIG
jgi:histidine triad (HIT) family protein